MQILSSAPAETPSPAATQDRRDEAQRTIRNAGFVAASRVLHVAGATLFAILVPRLMGPASFGRYALLTSLSEWFAQLSNMGVISVLTRVVPELIASGREAESTRLFTNIFALRIVTATAAAAVYAIVAFVWLGEPDTIAAVLVGLALLCRILASICFALFLGRSQTLRWMAGDLLQRWLVLALVVAGGAAGGLRGACAGYFIATLLVLAVAMTGARRSIDWRVLDPSLRYLRPYLRLGLSFAVSQVLHNVANRSGALIVRVATGNYLQVGFLGAAAAMYQMGGMTVWQVAGSLTPFFVGRFHSGERKAVAGWLSRLLTLMVMGAVLVNFSVLFTGADLIPRLLGSAFAPVVTSLAPLAVALIPFSFAAIGRIVALLVDRPGVAALASAAELAVAWAAGPAMASWLGAPGAAAGMLIGVCAWAFVMWWPLRRALEVPFLPAFKALGLGAAFVPVAPLRGGFATNLLLLLASGAAYILLAVRLHIVSPRDIETLRQFTRRRGAPDAGAILSADE
ncbi:MAG TPA: hypothetical protein VNK41_06195 [Vicinamibacterales bacterium]|nr:hypothetical protein [Vicinamibacterales bacterium]